MIIEKYPYKKINRTTVDGKRLYDTESGPLPSVTTILDQTKPQDTIDGLNNWRKRIGYNEAAKITQEAANVGTAMHNLLENWVKDIDVDPGNNMLYRVAKRMAATVIDNIKDDISEIWGSEVNLYYPGLYAGTTDLVGIYKDRPTIMDFKQSNKLKKLEWIEDYKMQGSAYGMAHNALFNTNIEHVAIFICTRDCEFQLFELDATEFAEYSSKWALRVGQYYDRYK